VKARPELPQYPAVSTRGNYIAKPEHIPSSNSPKSSPFGAPLFQATILSVHYHPRFGAASSTTPEWKLEVQS
jgi:hypothetical protein